jgi:hypothetical protein
MAARAWNSLSHVGAVVYLSTLAAVAVIVVWYAMQQHETASQGAPEAPPSEDLACDVTTRARLSALPEASSLAISQRNPNVLWSLNDSGAPVVLALGTDGRLLGRVRITGASVSNWEDLSVAPCETGSCLYVADSGNGGGTQRNDVVIYRVREPSPQDKETDPADVFDAAYPDGEDHEAEAVFLVDGRLFLVTKGHPSLMFAFPRHMAQGSIATLERVGVVPTERFLSTSIPRRTRVTDAETSPDGRWVAMRTNDALLLYRSADILKHQLSEFWQTDLRGLEEPRGEGVAISDSGDLYVAGEGGFIDRPGTFAHLSCAMPE